jgi:hypothetical protein
LAWRRSQVFRSANGIMHRDVSTCTGAYRMPSGISVARESSDDREPRSGDRSFLITNFVTKSSYLQREILILRQRVRRKTRQPAPLVFAPRTDSSGNNGNAVKTCERRRSMFQM